MRKVPGQGKTNQPPLPPLNASHATSSSRESNEEEVVELEEELLSDPFSMDLYSEAYETTYPEELDKKTSLASKGKLYSLVDQVFGEANKRVEFAGGLNAIRRTKTNRHYRVVLNEIGLIGKIHTNSKEGSRKSSILKSDKLRSKQNPPEEGGKFDILGTAGGEDAHAVPDSERCAPAYGPFLQCVMGLNLDLPKMTDENGDPFLPPLSLQKLRAASQRIDEINARSDSIRKSSDDEEFQLKKKIMKHIANDNAYAIKNLLINKIRVPAAHKVPYDTNPGFFVLPCIPPNDAKDWTPGKEYEVVLICKSERVARLMIGGRGFNAREEGRVVSEAQPGDLNCARDLLTATIKALAESATREGCVCLLDDLIDSKDNARGMEQVLEASAALRTTDRRTAPPGRA